VVPAATVCGVGEHDVLVLVVADPGVAALGLGQVLRLATQAATRALLACSPLAGSGLLLSGSHETANSFFTGGAGEIP